MAGHDIRTVAGALDHADMAITIRYKQQEAQDLILAWEKANENSVAAEGNVA